MIQRWKKVKTKSLVKNDWIHLTEDSYTNNERVINWYLLRDNDSVVVFAKTPSKKILLIRQYRPGTDEIHWEFPAGAIDAHESDPLISAKRELLEETGYAGKSSQIIAKLTIDSSRHTAFCYGVFVADVEFLAEKLIDPFEEIEIGLFTTDQILEKIKNREMIVGTQIAFFFLAKDQGLL